MSPAPEADAKLGMLLFEVSKLIKRRFEDLTREYGMTLPQWRTLAELQKQGGISQSALAAAIDSDPMTISGILDRLEKRGVIEREPDPSDSRAKIARVTPEGAALVTTSRAVGREMVNQALDGLDEEEREALTRGLTHIQTNLAAMSVANSSAA